MQYLVFEDEKVSRLKPLVNFKPAYGLFTGFRSLAQKLEDSIAERVRLTWHLRTYLAPFYRERFPESIVNSIEEDELFLVNGRLLCDKNVTEIIVHGALDPGNALMQGDDLLFARLHRSRLSDLPDGKLPDLLDSAFLAAGLAVQQVSGFRLIGNVWDVMAYHTEEMERDAEQLESGRIDGDIHPSAAIVNRSNIFIAPGAIVKAGAVLDAEDGFIAVGPGAVVEPQAVLMQNVFLSPCSRVKAGSRVYSNVFVGTASKVGGEVEDSLIEPFANKQHDGFLGHSYISSWCNLGAGTNTSDLKNNYSNVKLVIDGREVTTGLQFLGLLMGDHAKCSINSMFNTGTIVGTGANIFGGGFPPKEVSSFTWGSAAEGFETYMIEKAVETARKVMGRRQVAMSSAYETMFRFVAAREHGRKCFI
ncbi:GlmU family protein [Chlorobium limicola]|uniref:Transferase n=1 Tax=Chlorobium limicola TaxID=1092 RepID=A0A124G715_CHLLI|nr:GlmU family protein [Chlorobium limicola]KUL21402.1 transferase [Chlorobium limicola]